MRAGVCLTMVLLAPANITVAQTPAPHGEVVANLQQLYVTVSRGEERVLDLEKQDFEVLDDGRKQQIVTFERGDIPFTAVLLIDASESMKGERFTAAVAGARAFIDGMKPLDEATVLAFSDRILAATPVCSAGEPLLEVLDGVEVDGGSAIHDYLFVALRAVERRQGRRVVIVLSDGEDVHSVLRMDEVRRVARSSRAQVYWARVVDPQVQAIATSSFTESHRPRHIQRVDSWQRGGRDRDRRELQAAVEESGGRVLVLSTAADIEQAFGRVLAELREQYAIGYYPTEDRNDGSWHNVEVRVAGSGLEVRTSEGYLDW